MVTDTEIYCMPFYWFFPLDKLLASIISVTPFSFLISTVYPNGRSLDEKGEDVKYAYVCV